jgi:hypothetical protein
MSFNPLSQLVMPEFEKQVKEVDADYFSIYQQVSNSLNGQRPRVELYDWAFAVQAVYFLLGVDMNFDDLYKEDHPPIYFRLNQLFDQVTNYIWKIAPEGEPYWRSDTRDIIRRGLHCYAGISGNRSPFGPDPLDSQTGMQAYHRWLRQMAKTWNRIRPEVLNLAYGPKALMPAYGDGSQNVFKDAPPDPN